MRNKILSIMLSGTMVLSVFPVMAENDTPADINISQAVDIYELADEEIEYTMAAREGRDTDENPSGGWGFMYAPRGTDEYKYMTAHDTSNGNDIWRSSPGEEDKYTRLNGSGVGHHPGKEDDVVITWTAPKAGIVNLKGIIKTTAPSQYNPDGVNLTIMKNEDSENPIKKIYTDCDSAPDGKSFDEAVEVSKGDMIYFRVDPDENNSSDAFDLNPVIKYVDGIIKVDCETVTIAGGETQNISITEVMGIDNPEITAVVDDENIAAVSVDGTNIAVNGLADGETFITIVAEGDGKKITKTVPISVISEKTVYQFSFNGAKESNPGDNLRFFVHLDSGSESYYVSDAKVEVEFDTDVLEIIDYKGNPVDSANKTGRVNITATPNKSISSTYIYDGSNTRIGTILARVKDDTDVSETTLRVVSAEVNGIKTPASLCSEDSTIEIHQNFEEDKNGDGLISVGDIAKAGKDGSNNDYLKEVAEKAGFYPVKRVVVVGIDGAGNSIDPVNAWYQPTKGTHVRFSEIEGGKPDNKKMKFYENTILKEGAYTLTALPCNKSESAQNWTAILHGYNYYDIPVEQSFPKERIDNTVAGAYYFPENDSKYSSFMKVAREAMPNRSIVSNSNWTAIDHGIIEQSIGTSLIPYSSRYAYDGRDEYIADTIVEQAENGELKNMSVMFIHLDELDHAGHDATKGFYSDPYYEEAVRKDKQVEKIYNAIYENDDLKEDTMFITTTDHGGQTAKHGGTEESELVSFITLNGPTINKGYTWDGSQTRDVPAFVAKSLGISSDSDWRGFLGNGNSAFMSQYQMGQYNVTGNKIYNRNNKISYDKIEGRNVTAVDITYLYSGDAPEMTFSDETEVLLKENIQENKIHMILYNPNGFGGEICQTSGVVITDAMLSDDNGREIYPFIENGISSIKSVVCEDDSEITDIKAVENIKINIFKTKAIPTQLAAAAYDKDGVLLSIDINDIGAESVNFSKVIKNPAYNNSEAATVKLFWFNNMEELIPISSPFEIK